MQDTISNIFTAVPDPRIEGRCLHKLSDILFISFCTMLSNGEDFEDMVEFGKQRQDWLEEILELPNGIPSHDTFNRIFQMIDNQSLGEILAEDAQSLIDSLEGKLINFDGKKIRGESPRSRGNKGLYILSAWASENRLCLGQTKVNDKSNEITAIPELIKTIDLTGSVVSLDAIGCQIEIAKDLRNASAHYLLSVKANQKNLFKEVSDEFTWLGVVETSEDWEYDHGRYEKRICQTVLAKDVLSPDILKKWKDIKTVVRIKSTRRIKGITTTETRYYISSELKDAVYYNNRIRGHWSIENALHWHLDVTFNEDACRSRTGNAPLNLNIMRKMALHRISRQKDSLSLKKRRYKASMNTDYLEKLVKS
jgi:predicted transposase YbfD/YdcC